MDSHNQTASPAHSVGKHAEYTGCDLNIFLLPGNEAIREAVEAGAGATIFREHVVAFAITVGTLRAHPIDLPPRDFVLLQHRDRHARHRAAILVNHLVTANAAANGKSG